MRIPLLVSLLFLCSIVFPASTPGVPQLKKHNAQPLDAESDISTLESWETPIAGFFVRSHLGVPVVHPETWFVEINGLVDTPLKLSLQDLEQMEQVSFHAVLECSGNGRALKKPTIPGVQWKFGAVGNGEWTGVRLKDLLQKAGVKKEAKFITVSGADLPQLPSVPPFVRSVPLEKALESDTIIALKMNREPLPILHGGPTRLILPRWYGESWIKWVTHITLTSEEDPRFFMAKAYRMPKKPLHPNEKWDGAKGDPIQELRVQSILTYPRDDEAITKGEHSVQGKAFSGYGTIQKVEISLDGGKTWKPAQVEPPHPDGGWQEFSYNANFKKAGTYEIVSRATDTKKNTQPVRDDYNPGGYLHNALAPTKIVVLEKALPNAENLFQEKCFICHTSGLVEGLELPREGWDKVITKMEGFGAILTEEEHTALLNYLSSGKKFRKTEPMTDFETETAILATEPPKFANLDHGDELYKTNCAQCHGAEAEGKIGPRLRGRTIPSGSFWYTVMNGKQNMPAFGQVLSRGDVSDIRAFLLEK